MTKEQYREHLKDPRWKKCRMDILNRDRHKCTKCSKTEHLHVHHKKYIEGRMPWEVPHKYLITLCAGCHLKEHKDKPISSFVIKDKNKCTDKQKAKNQKVKKKEKIKPRQVKLHTSNHVHKLSRRDLSLSSRYKQLKQEGKLAS